MSEELQKLLSLEARMDRLEKLLLIGAKEDLTPEEAALFMGVDVRQIYKLTTRKAPVIGFSQPGGKMKYILKSDLVDYMRSGRRFGKKEIESQAKNFAKS